MHGYELRKRLNAVLGVVPGVLLRLALPLPARRCSARGLDRRGSAADGRAPAAGRQAGQDRLRAHRRGQGALRRTCSPRPARRPGRTTASASTSRSSPAPTPTSGCGSSRAGAAGSRSGSSSVRDVAGPHPRAARQLHPRAAAARPRVGRARGPLAERADRRPSARHATDPRDPDRTGDRTDADSTGRTRQPPDRTTTRKKEQPDGFRSRRHRRRRQLRRVARPGRRVLPGRRPDRPRSPA